QSIFRILRIYGDVCSASFENPHQPNTHLCAIFDLSAKRIYTTFRPLSMALLTYGATKQR
ncbi:MAG: hypothetical protein ACFFDI_17185, partial [Promethearchaeota archaeon]